MKIISITGTKGKTTVTRVLSHVIHKLGGDTLRVDTDGHYVNETQKSTLTDSKNIFSLVPTVCPGKYLLDMRKFYPHFTAILETAIGSSGKGGLGYGLHQIGIFTNVLEDHLGISKRLKTRMDIAKAKQFIFSALDRNGYAVFNADDRYVCSQLKHIPDFREVTKLPFGFDFRCFDIEKHLAEGGKCITVEADYFVVKSANKTEKILAVNEISWAFGGFFKPSVYNLMAILGGLYVHCGNTISAEAIKHLKNYKLDKYGGRLTLFENNQGVKILLDYAHEKYSLLEVGKLAKKIAANKTIGVVRLAPDRTDKMLFETGKAIANSFDNLIVYDKIDGVNRKTYVGTKLDLTRQVGEVSEIFLSGILSAKKHCPAKQIIIEESAIKEASILAEKGDVVVVICGDDHHKTVNSIIKYFKAEFA